MTNPKGKTDAVINPKGRQDAVISLSCVKRPPPPPPQRCAFDLQLHAIVAGLILTLLTPAGKKPG